jgi:hypothetical protein
MVFARRDRTAAAASIHQPLALQFLPFLQLVLATANLLLRRLFATMLHIPSSPVHSSKLQTRQGLQNRPAVANFLFRLSLIALARRDLAHQFELASQGMHLTMLNLHSLPAGTVFLTLN